MAKVFHVLTDQDKKNCVIDGIYRPKSLTSDGFIHLSKADQIETVINNFYNNNSQLILWRISEANLTENLKYEAPLEAPNSGLRFPHYYQGLEVRLIEKEFRLNKTNNQFKLPPDLLA